MPKFSRVLVVAAALLGSSSLQSANAYVVISTSPAWVVFTSGAGTVGWALPATIPGCAEENNAAQCEPVGDFILDRPFIAAGYYEVGYDADGSASDYLIWTNTGPGGNGEVKAYSDPTTPPDLTGLTLLGQPFFEPVTLGRTGGDDVISFRFNSDSENQPYDPLGIGIPSSDQILFYNGAITVPEPLTLGLFGTGLAGLAALRRRKQASSRSRELST